MKKISLLLLLILALTGCTSKGDVVDANKNSSKKNSIEVTEKLVFKVGSGDMTYKYITSIDNENNLFKNEFIFDTSSNETRVVKYTILENNAVRNFVNVDGDGDWHETNDEFRTDYFLCEDHIEKVSKENGSYIVSISPNLFSRFLRSFEVNAPFDYEHLKTLRYYDVIMTIENDLVKSIEVDLLDIINTDNNEEVISYDEAFLKITYNYDDFELLLPDEIINIME